MFEGVVRLTADRIAEMLGVVRYAKESGRWITIGGSKGEDGKHHGGSPVYIENGRITKGAPSLTGKKIDALKEEAEEGTHRQQLHQGRNYDRAIWSKKARAEGIKPEHLHQLAGELLAHDKAYKADKTAILKDARQRLDEFGGEARTLHLHQDKDEIKDVDEVADALSETYGTEITGDDLMAMLHQGNPKPMTEAEALEEAFDQLTAAKPAESEGDAFEPEGGDSSFDFGENASSPRDATWQGNLFSDFKQSVVKQPKLFADAAPEEKKRPYLEGQKVIDFGDKYSMFQGTGPRRYTAEDVARIVQYAEWNPADHPRDRRTGVFVDSGTMGKTGDANGHGGPEAKLFDPPKSDGPEAKLLDAPKAQPKTAPAVPKAAPSGNLKAELESEFEDARDRLIKAGEASAASFHSTDPDAARKAGAEHDAADKAFIAAKQNLLRGTRPAAGTPAAAASPAAQTKPPRAGFAERRAKHQARAAKHEAEFAQMTPEEREAHKAERDAKAAVHVARRRGEPVGLLQQLVAAWKGAKKALGGVKKAAKQQKRHPATPAAPDAPLGTPEPANGNVFDGFHDTLIGDRLGDIAAGRHLRHQAEGAPERYSVFHGKRYTQAECAAILRSVEE